MKRITKSSLAVMLAATTLLFTGCGGDGEQQSFIDSWKIGTVGHQLQVNAVFNQQYTIDGEAMVQFKDYGSIYIGQDDNRHFSVSLLLDTAVLGDIDLQPVSTLPTGFMFPNIVDMTLYAATITENANMRVIAYFGTRDANGNLPKKTLAGLAIELRAIGNNFPMLSITQNFFDANNQRYASFSLYGPKLSSDNQVLVPGGLFLAADITKTIGMSQPMLVGEKLSVEGPHASYFKSPRARAKMLKAMFNELKAQGIVREQ